MVSPGGAAAAVATTLAAGLGVRWALHAIRTHGAPRTTKLSAQVSGLPPKKGTPMLVMLSGFCDDHGSFSEVVPSFQDSHTVVTMVMPDYDTQELSSFWGYNLGEIYLHAAGNQRVDRLVLMDVGAKIPTDAANMRAVMPYQLWLSFSFLIERCTLPIIGTLMAFVLFPWKAIGPCPYETKMPKRTSGPPGARIAYPYLRTFVSRALGRFPRMSAPAGAELPLPVPTTYVYGKHKRATFHTQGFLNWLDALPGYGHVGLDCGHFIQAQMPEELAGIIRERMK
eukprot:jgi/Tetstr1/428775/TSEL_018763.t1